jgi:hypothetical protein
VVGCQLAASSSADLAGPLDGRLAANHTVDDGATLLPRPVSSG